MSERSSPENSDLGYATRLEREAFKQAHKHLDLTEVQDAWGCPMFEHSHIEAMWDGWKLRASQPATPTGGEATQLPEVDQTPLRQAKNAAMEKLYGTGTPSSPDIVKRFADEIERLQTENWQLKQACGYPIPADKETPQNPFKCGICDARSSAGSETSCDACGKTFQPNDDVVLMGSRGNFHQSCFLARSSAGNDTPPRPISREEMHAIGHARYLVERATPDNPEVCFDYELVKDLLDVIDRDALRFTDAAQPSVTPAVERLQATYNDLLAVQDQTDTVPLTTALDAVGLALSITSPDRDSK